MVQTLLAVSAIVPSVLLVWYFHARDAYPEPARVIWATFGFGVLAVIPVLAVGIPIHLAIATIEHPVLASGLEAFFVAAIPEEFFKLVVLLLYCTRKQAFDEPMDGVVYGVVASLGFAALENILYVVDGGTSVAFSRAFTAVPFHAFLGAIMGYYVGQAWKNPRRRTTLIVRGFLIATFLHGIYDLPLMTLNALNGDPNLLLVAATLVVLIFAWYWALRLSRGLRREQLVHKMTQLAPGTGDATLAPAVRSRVIPVMQIAVGVISASLGGMVVFGLLLAFLMGIVAVDDTADVVFGGALIGVAPLAAGGLFFRYGVRGLNRREI